MWPLLAILSPPLAIILCVRQKAFDEQCPALPLVGKGNAYDQSISVSAGIEYKAALDLVRRRIVLAHVSEPFPAGMAGGLPPIRQPIACVRMSPHGSGYRPTGNDVHPQNNSCKMQTSQPHPHEPVPYLDSC